jgi:hypothetical protein
MHVDRRQLAVFGKMQSEVWIARLFVIHAATIRRGQGHKNGGRAHKNGARGYL